MSIFGAIMDKIFHHGAAARQAAAPAPQVAAAAPATPTPAPATVAAAPAPQAVDVEAVLTSMASQKGGGGTWQSSIVD
ncbi:MAG: DUF3597 family protein, partial [Caulobacteraceae bacterium]